MFGINDVVLLSGTFLKPLRWQPVINARVMNHSRSLSLSLYIYIYIHTHKLDFTYVATLKVKIKKIYI